MMEANPLNHAIRTYAENGIDFAEILKWHLAFGFVVSLPDCFMFGFFCDKELPIQPKGQAESDCAFITMCVGSMRQAGMQIVELAPWIAYQREFKGDSRIRVKEFRKFYQRIKLEAH
jgi:hypothetical protein